MKRDMWNKIKGTILNKVEFEYFIKLLDYEQIHISGILLHHLL